MTSWLRQAFCSLVLLAKDGSGKILSWKRYELEGLNHLRIDEVYDLDDDGYIEDPATSGDDWRIERVTVNGPGQLGQIVKQIVYAYTSATTGTVDSTSEYFLGYDVLGNVSVISDAAGNEVDQFEQDAFGNDPENTWTNPAGGITEHLTTKQYDDFLGLYYFNARWYDAVVGAFVSVASLPSHQEHPYGLAASDPANRYDVTGHQPAGGSEADILEAASICNGETSVLKPCEARVWSGNPIVDGAVRQTCRSEPALHELRQLIVCAIRNRKDDGKFSTDHFAPANSTPGASYNDCLSAARSVYNGGYSCPAYTHFYMETRAQGVNPDSSAPTSGDSTEWWRSHTPNRTCRWYSDYRADYSCVWWVVWFYEGVAY